MSNLSPKNVPGTFGAFGFGFTKKLDFCGTCSILNQVSKITNLN